MSAFGLGNTAPRLVHPGLEKCAVEPGQHRAFFDVRAVADRLRRFVWVSAEALDQAGHLGPDVDDFLGLDRSGRVDR